MKVTLTEPEVAGDYIVAERNPDGSLLLAPDIAPTIEELEAEHGERVQGEDFERRWSHLPRDGQG